VVGGPHSAHCSLHGVSNLTSTDTAYRRPDVPLELLDRTLQWYDAAKCPLNELDELILR
jgi:hypothetical protein